MSQEFRDLFVDELRDVYSAENQILKALPKMVKAAQNKELKQAFSDHLAASKVHVERLNGIFESLGLSKKGKLCKGMEGLLAEGAEVIAEDLPGAVKDAALIAAAQRVEHYEMAAYGCLRAFAKALGELDVARVLQATLDEEGDADRLLSQIAEFAVNLEASSFSGSPSPSRRSLSVCSTYFGAPGNEAATLR
jgi:ferritin-like metal-binding protein YciE